MSLKNLLGVSKSSWMINWATSWISPLPCRSTFPAYTKYCSVKSSLHKYFSSQSGGIDTLHKLSLSTHPSMQWAAVTTQCSFTMLPPHLWVPSHRRDTTEGYFPWGASVPFTMRWSVTTFSKRWGKAACIKLVLILAAVVFIFTKSSCGENEDADCANHDYKWDGAGCFIKSGCTLSGGLLSVDLLIN